MKNKLSDMDIFAFCLTCLILVCYWLSQVRIEKRDLAGSLESMGPGTYTLVIDQQENVWITESEKP